MNIGTQVTFNLGWETKTGEIIWISNEFAWVKDQTDTVHKILISGLKIV
jgi:hypothetical protein